MCSSDLVTVVTAGSPFVRIPGNEATGLRRRITGRNVFENRIGAKADSIHSDEFLTKRIVGVDEFMKQPVGMP